MTTVACSQPHAAFAALTHAFSSKWAYLSRVVPDIQDLLQPLEDSIGCKLLLALTTAFGLTGEARRDGNLEQSPVEFRASSLVTDALTSVMLRNEDVYSYDIVASQLSAKSDVT